MINSYIIVDTHTHTYQTPEKARLILQSFTSLHQMEPSHLGKGTIEEVLLNMQLHHIDYTLMANFAPVKILHNNNLWTISMSKEHPSLIPLVSLHPDMKEDTLILLKEYIALGAKGLKFHTGAQSFIPNHKNLQNVYEYCNKISFPILFHCGLTSKVITERNADLDMLLPVIENYRNIPIILAHMAEGNINDVLSLSQKYKNLYFDTSIVISGLLCIKRVHDDCWQNDELVIDVIHKVGAQKIIFGSDYPFGSPIHDVRRFLNMNISDAEKKLILGENTLRIFGITRN